MFMLSISRVDYQASLAYSNFFTFTAWPGLANFFAALASEMFDFQ